MQTLSTAFTVSSPPPFYTPPNRSEQILRELPQALLVVLPDRRLLFANASAETLLANRQARQVEGRLMDLGQLSAPMIEDVLRQARDRHGVRTGLWFKGLQTGWVSASRVPFSIASGADWPLDSVLLLVHLDEPQLTQSARIEALCQHCGLTPAERYVLLLLADGMVAQDVARHLAVRVCTVRTHIRNLLGKTSSPSLMQLVRQVGSTQPLDACRAASTLPHGPDPASASDTTAFNPDQRCAA